MLPFELNFEFLSGRILVLFLGISGLSVIVYRSWLHPLSAIPGPRLAAITSAWLIYWNVIQRGKFINEVPRLHRKYGRVIRISPNEVLIHEPELYHQIYSSHSVFLKSRSFYNGFGFETASFSLIDPNRHQFRRRALASLFSKKAVSQLENLLHTAVNNLCEIVKHGADNNLPIPLQNAFYCLTVDVISAYCFGESFEMLKEPHLEGELVENVLSFTNSFWLIIHFPYLIQLALSMPKFLGNLLAKQYIRHRSTCEDLVQKALSSDHVAPEKIQVPHTIFQALIAPGDERTTENLSFTTLVDEAVNLLTAGTDSSAAVLTFSVYYFVTEHSVRDRIQKELQTVSVDSNGRLSLTPLQQLPYFTAFIKEVMRFSNIVPGRLPRTIPNGGLVVPSVNLFIPEGATVSMSHLMIHRDPVIFTAPDKFDPQRWLDNKGLDHWLMSFSKGIRGCLGMNLAFAEIYLVLGNLFAQFDIQLFETTENDMTWVDNGVAHIIGRLRVTVKNRSSSS